MSIFKAKKKFSKKQLLKKRLREATNENNKLVKERTMWQEKRDAIIDQLLN